MVTEQEFLEPGKGSPSVTQGPSCSWSLGHKDLNACAVPLSSRGGAAGSSSEASHWLLLPRALGRASHTWRGRGESPWRIGRWPLACPISPPSCTWSAASCPSPPDHRVLGQSGIDHGTEGRASLVATECRGVASVRVGSGLKVKVRSAQNSTLCHCAGVSGAVLGQAKLLTTGRFNSHISGGSCVCLTPLPSCALSPRRDVKTLSFHRPLPTCAWVCRSSAHSSSHPERSKATGRPAGAHRRCVLTSRASCVPHCRF